jgi:hypothetical protein
MSGNGTAKRFSLEFQNKISIFKKSLKIYGESGFIIVESVGCSSWILNSKFYIKINLFYRKLTARCRNRDG